ncbi:MAG: hypothetical protein JWO67_1372 [Streptosporangiaceae bacterium]|jgi:Fe-S cluster biogenesis protein NfuA|nr:hypothetical protein [Streptosporangiaceae bacterium]
MPNARNVHAPGDRAEILLTELRELAGPATAEKAEELVRTVVELYGAGLERILRIVVEMEAVEPLHRLTRDRLVAGLLILHDLHPFDTGERVRTALEETRPGLGLRDGDVELLEITGEGVARLRLRAGCQGCASTRTTVTQSLERAVAEAAPEISRVDIEETAEPAPTLLQIQPRPPRPAGAVR